MITVMKRNGDVVPFEREKIEVAILKAMKYGSGIVDEDIANNIAHEIERDLEGEVSIATIENLVFTYLIEQEQVFTAKAYEGYRKVREFQRSTTAIDDKVMGVVDGSNKETLEENSNKNATIVSTQRDLIAGEVSKDMARRLKIPAHIVQAHDEGLIHYHDMDYAIQPIFNCCLVDLDEMLSNGTVINGKGIETPRSFATACTLSTQIVQQVANGQYGGQTISLTHLAPYVRVSYDKHYERHLKRLMDEPAIAHNGRARQLAEKYAIEDTKTEIKNGVQTIQYQINTFSSSNGQAPFLSIYMDINEDKEYTKEVAMITEEVLRQRLKGMQNEDGVYVTPAFPKLLYVLDENNITKDSEYWYLTELSVECASKRMMPDYISGKIMRENHKGNVFGCMGCRSFLSTDFLNEDGSHKFYGRFNQGK